MNKGCLIGTGLFLLVSAIGLGMYFVAQGEGGEEDIRTENPVITDIIKKTVATGSIKPRQEVHIKPQVSGVVDELYVEPGQMVEKGERLARIKLIPNQININSARSNVELARLRLREAQRELERQREIFSKNLDVESARVNYENAQEEEERQRQLFEEGIISEQDYNRFRVDLNLAKATYENARISSANDLRQFENEVEIRKEELESAINNLQLLQEGASRNSRQVANIVTSTVRGMVLDVPVEEGTSVIERNNFNEGTTIAIVADMNSLIFEGKVDESDVGRLSEGMPLELSVGAIQEKTFQAGLEYISPKGEDEDGTVKFEIRAALQPVEEVFLRAGYSANADIILDRAKQVVAVKERDLIYEDSAVFVEVANNADAFEKRKVQLGISDGIMVQVINGIDTTSRIKVREPRG
ncbi:MAG: efflux RND transporter periplasmic adaptor subunit [Saprospiraceae bacterium]|nr:efflux RND transporter periplasmic adaptor subunit [Saprospiraceae bacterium]